QPARYRIAESVEGREHLAGESRGLGQDLRHQVRARLAIAGQSSHVLEPGDLRHDELHVPDRSLIRRHTAPISLYCCESWPTCWPKEARDVSRQMPGRHASIAAAAFTAACTGGGRAVKLQGNTMLPRFVLAAAMVAASMSPAVAGPDEIVAALKGTPATLFDLGLARLEAHIGADGAEGGYSAFVHYQDREIL